MVALVLGWLAVCQAACLTVVRDHMPACETRLDLPVIPVAGWGEHGEE